MKINRFVAVFFVFCMFLSPQSENIEKRKKEIDAEISTLVHQKSSLLNDIYKYELLYEKEQIKARAIEVEYKVASAEIKELSKKKDLLHAKMIVTKENLTQSLRIIYKTKEQTPFLFIIRINTINNLFKHYHYFQKLFSYNALTLSDIKSQTEELLIIEKKIKVKLNLASSLKESILLTMQQIQRNKERQVNFLSKINKDYQHFKQLLDEIKIQETELSKVISGQPSEKKIEKINSEALRGQLPWPLQGKVLNQFGKVKSSQFNTYVFNNGIRIKPDKSENIHAVYQGVVLWATYFKGYGKLLVLRHSRDLYTLYGHCANITKAVGDWVNQNEIIATVGDTGSTMGKVLYFEIRKGINSENPLKWFSKKKR